MPDTVKIPKQAYLRNKFNDRRGHLERLTVHMYVHASCRYSICFIDLENNEDIRRECSDKGFAIIKDFHAPQ